MGDEHLQLLLRRFAADPDPESAMRFAVAYLNLYGSSASEIKWWPDNRSFLCSFTIEEVINAMQLVPEITEPDYYRRTAVRDRIRIWLMRCADAGPVARPDQGRYSPFYYLHLSDDEFEAEDEPRILSMPPELRDFITGEKARHPVEDFLIIFE
jgi:hypothetical protein